MSPIRAAAMITNGNAPQNESSGLNAGDAGDVSTAVVYAPTA